MEILHQPSVIHHLVTKSFGRIWAFNRIKFLKLRRCFSFKMFISTPLKEPTSKTEGVVWTRWIFMMNHHPKTPPKNGEFLRKAGAWDGQNTHFLGGRWENHLKQQNLPMTVFEMWIFRGVLRLMEEILLTSWGLVVYPIIYKGLNIPGGDIRISEPSTVTRPKQLCFFHSCASVDQMKTWVPPTPFPSKAKVFGDALACTHHGMTSIFPGQPRSSVGSASNPWVTQIHKAYDDASPTPCYTRWQSSWLAKDLYAH